MHLCSLLVCFMISLLSLLLWATARDQCDTSLYVTALTFPDLFINRNQDYVLIIIWVIFYICLFWQSIEKAEVTEV